MWMVPLTRYFASRPKQITAPLWLALIARWIPEVTSVRPLRSTWTWRVHDDDFAAVVCGSAACAIATRRTVTPMATARDSVGRGMWACTGHLRCVDPPYPATGRTRVNRALQLRQGVTLSSMVTSEHPDFSTSVLPSSGW